MSTTGSARSPSTRPSIDWSGNCGNLSAAVGPFAISMGLVGAPADGTATVRIWQANIGKKIISHVPMRGGEVQELGDFELDGVAFPAAEVRLEFLDPADDESGSEGGAMFPTGNRIDVLDVPGAGQAGGDPDQRRQSDDLRRRRSGSASRGTELQGDVNGKAPLLALAESVRARGAVAMGLAATPEEATAKRQHTPKLAFVARPAGYTASDGKPVEAKSIDLLARIFSMGVLHHAMTGTGAVAIAAAAAIPGTIVYRVAPAGADGRVRFGHPSGSLTRRRGSARGGRAMGDQEGLDEPLRPPPDGRLGPRAGLTLRWGPERDML